MAKGFRPSLWALAMLPFGMAGCSAAAIAGDAAAKPARFPAGEVQLDIKSWPVIGSAVPQAPRAKTEKRIDAILKRMSVEEKVGQLLQPEIMNITPEEVKKYHIGSVLNGGNGRPNKNVYAPAADWLKLADAFWTASTDKADGGAGVPIIWGIDSVHGNNSVFGGTIFPHNIGLGAANDAKLMVEIGRVTAVESAAIGTDWTFAPALSIPRDDRWGRTYEGFSEDPKIAGILGAAYTKGLQGDPKGKFFPAGSIIATAKHFVADGGTQNGRDQGDAVVPRANCAIFISPPMCRRSRRARRRSWRPIRNGTGCGCTAMVRCSPRCSRIMAASTASSSATSTAMR